MKIFRLYHELGEYDGQKLKEAKRLIQEVYEYHSGDSLMKSEVKRLETILIKLEYLINLTTESKTL